MDGKTIYRNRKPLLYTAATFVFLPAGGLGLPGQSDAPEPLAQGIPDTLPYAAQSVIIVCFRNAVAGTPIGDTHSCGTVLAFPDLCGPFL